jgi:hypothetical protein
MPDLKTILTEITELTNTIETDYPELYKYLDEEPITIPAFEHPDMDKQLMKEYLDGLKQVLKQYIKTHQKTK